MIGIVFLATESAGDTLTGKVVGVMSGDTLTVLTAEEERHKVRLQEVDAPELSQTFGKQARQFTRDLVYARRVQVNYRVTDQFGRLIGEVTLADGRILNQELLRHGFAWHYRVHHPGNESLRELEYTAWKKKSGLWVDPSPLPPWEYRRESFPPDPPENPSQMDYDRVFSYGLIGDPETKMYYWPGCQNYPNGGEGFIFFGSKLAAADAGFEVSPNCPGG